MREGEWTTIGTALRLIGGLLIACSAIVGVFGLYNLQSDFVGTRFEGSFYVVAAIGASFHGIALIGFGVLIDLQAASQAHLQQLVHYAAPKNTGAPATATLAIAASLSTRERRSFPVPPDGAPYASLMDPKPVEEGTHRGRRMKTLEDGSVIIEKANGWWRYPSLADANRYGGS